MTALTIFCAPRDFTGEFARIQRNAIYSWKCLNPSPDVLVFGGGADAESICSELGADWIGEVASTSSGAPLLDELFRAAQERAKTEFVAYANPDVIFLRDVASAIDELERRFGRFIAVGAPRNAAFTDVLEGTETEWMTSLGPALATATLPAAGSGADLFVFPRGSLDPIPRLAIGRLGWDNWLLWRCATNPLPSIDVTSGAHLVHQDHSGTTHRGSVQVTHDRFAEDVRANLARLRRPETIARRSEIRYELGRDGRILRRRRPVGATLAARSLRLYALEALRRTPLSRAVDAAEASWKRVRSG